MRRSHGCYVSRETLVKVVQILYMQILYMQIFHKFSTCLFSKMDMIVSPLRAAELTLML